MKNVIIKHVDNLLNINISSILYDDGLLVVDNLKHNSILLHLTGPNGSEKFYKNPLIITLVDNGENTEYSCNITRIDCIGSQMSFVNICEKKIIEIINSKFPPENRIVLSNIMKSPPTLVASKIEIGSVSIDIIFGKNKSKPENTLLSIDQYSEFTIQIPSTLINKLMPHSNLFVNNEAKVTVHQLFDITNYFLRINKMKAFW